MKNYARRSNEKLYALAKTGDEDALEELIRNNRPFLVQTAREVTGGNDVLGITREELIDEGVIGIYEAVQSFEPEKGFLFLTYAGRIVRNKMLDLINLFSNSRKHISLEQSREEEETGEGIDLIDRRVSVEEFVVRKVFLEEVRACFLELSPRQQQILAYKFGIDRTKHPLECEGRNLPDSMVATYFNSKESLIRKNTREAGEVMRRKLFSKHQYN